MRINITYISPSVYRSRGYRQREAISSRLWDHLAPTSIAVATRVLAEELAIEAREEKDLKRSRRINLEFIRKDGSTCWNEANLTFMRDTEGKAVGILGVSRDISDRKREKKNTRRAKNPSGYSSMPFPTPPF